MEEIALQAILGTDTKNPFLTLLREKDSKHIHIYYGTNLLEIVPDDPEHIGFRTAAGRLYNAGIKRKVLSELFGFDRRTLQSWGNALKEKRAQESLRILSGRKNYKTNCEIIAFARVRFINIYQENHYSYSKQIRKEIEEVYQVPLSSETLRPLFNQWKKEMVASLVESDVLSKKDNTESQRQDSCECDNCSDYEKGLKSKELSGISDENNRKFDVSAEQKQWFIRHAGIGIFASYISQIGQVFGAHGLIVKQWLCMIFLEAVNIEQSKYLDFTSLSRLLGYTIRRPFTQRVQLGELADDHQSAKIFKLNAALCNCDQCSDFYYDPHTKHYTGMSKILKGWCSSIGHADKVLYSDFIHSSKGQPLFMMHYDNYYDLRERYQVVVREFRNCIGIDVLRRITLILDRGIFKSAIFEQILDDPTLEIITWEKDFKPCPDLWQTHSAGFFCMKKYRNSSRDIRPYLFRYIDSAWDKNLRMRRLIVQATNPTGKTVELGVLTTDHTRPAQQIISLIFRRWIQENDFKYLDKHYGINQIISYDTIAYSKLRLLLDDKEIVSGTYKALHYDKMLQEKKLKDIIFRKHCQYEKVAQAKQQLQEIETQMENSTHEKLSQQSKEAVSEMFKKRRNLRAKFSRWKNNQFNDTIKEYTRRLEEISEKLEANQEKVSKLDMLINEGYQRLDIEKKRFMDALKIYARNIFYHIFETFRLAYDNFRDDHEYFRNLTHADGIYRESDDKVEIMIFPSAHLEPKTRSIIQKILDDLTSESPETIDGSGKKLILTLYQNEALEVANV